MIGVTGSRLHFWKYENFRNRKIYVFSPTRGRGFSRYGVMVKFLGGLLIRTRSLVPHVRQLKYPILLINWCPPCLSFACFLLYLYHSSLVSGMLICIVGLKEYGLVTQSLRLGWPLPEVVTQVGAEEDLFHPSPLHKLGMPSWSEGQEHYTTLHLPLFTGSSNTKNMAPKELNKILLHVVNNGW